MTVKAFQMYVLAFVLIDLTSCVAEKGNNIYFVNYEYVILINQIISYWSEKAISLLITSVYV